MNNNRNYIWDNEEISIRPEYAYIERWISNSSKVIDLGCGNGSLLQILREKRDVVEFGIEISESGVALCRKKGLNVRIGRIDEKFSDIEDNAFDFAICNVTLQMVMYPEITLMEMKRISRNPIISFPNFAFLPNRLEFLTKGRMPQRLLYGYKWYNTGHIHQLSIKDFKETILSLGLVVMDSVYHGRFGRLKYLIPNIFASEAIFLLKKNE